MLLHLPFALPHAFKRPILGSLLLACLALGVIVLPGRGRAQDDPGAGAACAPSPTPYLQVQIDTAPQVQLELARTPQEHQVGLMFRDSLPPDSGMLFIYDHPATEGYWMRNTLIPLSIAFIDRDGTIVDIQDMQPLDEIDIHFPAAPYWYALEVN